MLANLRTIAKRFVPAPAGILVGWAAGASAGAPPPDALTIAAITTWLSVPFHWSYIVGGMVGGLAAFFSLREFISPTPAPLIPEVKELTAKIDALTQLMLRQNPAGAQQIESFATTATDLAGSDSAEDRSIAREAVEGDPLAASDRLMAEVETGVAEQAERARQAARIAAPFSVAKAITAYARAVELDPADFGTWIELSRLHRAAGSLPLARRTAEAALQHVGDDHDRMVAEGELGDIAVAEGQLSSAVCHYETAMLISKALVEANPDNPNLQRQLSVSHQKLGDVALAEGDLVRAFSTYSAGLAIVRQLVVADPGNATWQSDLSVSHRKLGDVARDKGDVSNARSAYTAGLMIAERLAATEPGNAGRQRDLAVSHGSLGILEMEAGNLDAAHKEFKAILPIFKRLVASESGNTGWQRDLSVSHNKLGDIALAQGNLAGARCAYDAGLAIAERLAASDPDNATWHLDLYVCHDRMARIAQASGDIAGAIAEFEAGEVILVALIARVGDHPGFARDLANVRGGIVRLREE